MLRSRFLDLLGSSLFALLSVFALAADSDAQTLQPSSVPGINVPPGFDAEVLSTGLTLPTGVAVEASGNLIFGSNCLSCPVVRVSPTGVVIDSSSPIGDPDGVAVDSLGRVLVTSGGSITIANSLDGGTDAIFATGFSNLNDIVIDSDDRIFVHEDDGRVRGVTASGPIEPPFATTSGGGGLGLDPVTGGLLATGCTTGNVIEISPTGTVSVLAPIPGPSVPADAEAGPGGPFGSQVYVSLFSEGKIVTVDRSSGAITTFATGLTGPHRIAFAFPSELLVLEQTLGRVIKIAPVDPCIPDYPGTGEDLFLGTGVNMFPTIGDCFDVKTATAGDFLSLWLVSLGGTFDADPSIVVAQAFPTGGPAPVGFPFPGLHVDINQMIVLVNGAVMTELGWSQVIGPPGSFYNIQVPPGLEGMSIILQGGTLSPNALDGFLALTDAHELQIVPGG